MQNNEKVQLAADALGSALLPCMAASGKPLVGMVLGTGLGGVADALQGTLSVPFADLPGFPVARVSSHTGRFLLGTLAGVPVLVQQGRCHLYEGYSPFDVTLGTRVMAALGVRGLVLTNAAGAVNPQFRAGEIMLISDHINATGRSALTGVNHDAWGPRFPDCSSVYDRDFMAAAEEEALAVGIRMEKGVYLATSGPELETPAETRAYRIWGADAVGMSTVLEAVAARHMGVRVIGFSSLSNKNLPDCMEEVALEEIVRVSGVAGEKLGRLLPGLVVKMSAMVGGA